jgi:hypothetical protein
MFNHTTQLNISEVERQLKADLANVGSFVGQLRFTKHDYDLVSQLIKRSLREDRDDPLKQLRRIPSLTLLVMMVFCARYKDTSVQRGFWSPFLESLELINDPNARATCREHFKKAVDILRHLYFPADGYEYVTKILYHAIIPQACVAEMANLLRKLDQDVGWDLISEMDIERLEAHLPEAASRLHTPEALRRFIRNANSRRLATKLVQDLCEIGYLHQRGDFLAEEIERLLEDQPVQQEVWESLLQAPPTAMQSAKLRFLFDPPQWQWDVKGHQVRLFFPRQRIALTTPPHSFVIGKRNYPIKTNYRDGCWEIEPIYLSGLPINWMTGSDVVKVKLQNEDGILLRSWSVGLPQNGVLFFRSNAEANIGFYVDSGKGLSSGEWLVLYQRSLHIFDSNGKTNPLRRLIAPHGFEGYEAVLLSLQPDLEISDLQGEAIRIPLAGEEPRSIKLIGSTLNEADDPAGMPVFTRMAPIIEISAEEYEEIKGLDVQLRVMTSTQGTQAYLHPVQSLLKSGIAEWSESQKNLRIVLARILPDGCTGRFRIKILQGLQSARYAPTEFVIVPALCIAPSYDEFTDTLYTLEKPPQIQITSPESFHLTSDNGKVTLIPPSTYRIEWSPCATELTAKLQFEHFTLPLRWQPHILRSAFVPRGESVAWSTHSISISQEALSFYDTLYIEGFPDNEFEIWAGEKISIRNRFNSAGHFQFKLPDISDSVREAVSSQVPIFILIRRGEQQYKLLLLDVLKKNCRSPEWLRRLFRGQKVVHRDYGSGVFEALEEKCINGRTIETARFHFSQYGGVIFFIPISRSGNMIPYH